MGANILMANSLRFLRTCIRLISPYVFWTVRESLWLMALSMVSTFRGSADTSTTIARQWTQTAIERGMPMQLERWLYMICWLTAILMNLIGWLLLAHLTVFVFRLVFF